MKKFFSFAAGFCSVVLLLSFTTFAIDLKAYINDYIKQFYCTDFDFYEDTITYEGETLPLNLPERELEYQKYGVLLNPLTYGSNGTTHYKGWGNVSTIGRDIYGDLVRPPFSLEINPYENEDIIEEYYHWETWTGNELAGKPLSYNSSGMRTWVAGGCKGNPWPIGEVRAYTNREYSLDGLEKLEDGKEKIELLEAAIQAGMDIVYGNPKIKGSMIRPTYSDSLRIHTKGAKPHGNGRWVDYIIVVIPPTDISWGVGLRFNKSGSTYWTIDIPIAPFKMAMPLDISVNFAEITSTANPGDVVTFKAEVRSNLDQETKDISYRWVIKDANGNNVNSSFGGHGTSVSGKFNTSDNKNITKQFYAQFTMPETAVNVTFEVNHEEDSKHPEKDKENNKATETVRILMPAPSETAGEVILDYDVYSKDHSSNLAAMTATFGHSGAITASMGASSQNTSILSYYSYQTSATGSGSSITVRPWYNCILYRSGFGDIPENRVYLPNGIFPLMVAQKANGNATVKWKETYSYTGSDGKTHSYTVTRRESSSFPTTITNLPVTAYVYNGGPVNQPATRNEVLRTDLAWTSNIIPFEVYRHMYHQDANGNKVNQKEIPGQYVRNFVDQNTASVVWSTPLTQANAYAADRRTAANRGAQYQNAIFATDKEFSRVDFPVKSGYMFNPLGTYQCVVNSTVYYDISASEQEKKQTHEELVNKVINSFVYDNGMTYTKDGKTPYAFRNVTNSNDPENILNVARRDNVTITTIPHTQYQKCMEGWEESNTLLSWHNYKYREYVRNDRVSRIDAQTVLTFTIGSNVKRYTHINLGDGQYAVTARSLPFSFKGLTAPGVHLNDGITVTVRGSIYDDRG